METRTVPMFVGGVQADLKVCEEGDKRWVECPAFKIESSDDAADVANGLQTTFPFLEGDAELEEFDDD